MVSNMHIEGIVTLEHLSAWVQVGKDRCCSIPKGEVTPYLHDFAT